MTKEQDRLFPNKFDNKEPTVPSSGTTLTFDFVNSGTDSATDYYYNLGNTGAYQVIVRPSVNVLIKSINGVTLTDPITVSTAGYTDTKLQILNMTIETTGATTSVKVYAKGGK